MSLAEKYRPDSLDDVVGQEKYVEQLKSMLNGDRFPHIMLFGPAGCGKTTMAHAYSNEAGKAIFELNASDERGIDTIREKVKEMSRMGGERLIFLDEADNITIHGQNALRRIMEKSAQQFILTGNSPNKVINPIKSRCVDYYLDGLSDKQVLKILMRILKKEGYGKESVRNCYGALKYLAKEVNGDARQALNYLEPLLSEDLDITKANLKTRFPDVDAKRIMKEVYDDNWKVVTDELNDVKNLNIDKLYDGIQQTDFPKHIQIRLYEKLGEVEQNLNYGASPTVQFTSFLASLWMFKYMNRTDIGGND